MTNLLHLDKIIKICFIFDQNSLCERKKITF